MSYLQQVSKGLNCDKIDEYISNLSQNSEAFINGQAAGSGAANRKIRDRSTLPLASIEVNAETGNIEIATPSFKS